MLCRMTLCKRNVLSRVVQCHIVACRCGSTWTHSQTCAAHTTAAPGARRNKGGKGRKGGKRASFDSEGGGVPGRDQFSTRNLYVSGLPASTRNEDLLQIFGQYVLPSRTHCIHTHTHTHTHTLSVHDRNSMLSCPPTGTHIHTHTHTHTLSLTHSPSSLPCLPVCRFGSIVSAKAIVAKDRPTECQGYGFVMFENAPDAAKAVAGLSNKPDIVVQFAKMSPRPRPSGARMEDPTNLYFSNLPLSYDEARLNVRRVVHCTSICTCTCTARGCLVLVAHGLCASC